MSRNEPPRWEKNRGVFLKLGFVLSISMVILAFNYSIYPDPIITRAKSIYTDKAVVEIVRTQFPKPTPPPPPALDASDDLLPQPEPVRPVNPPPIIDPGPGPELSPFDQEEYVSLPDPLPLPKDIDDGPLPPVVFAETMPRFPGCETEGLSKKEKEDCATRKMLEFLYSEVDYPKLAREAGIEGMVIVSFVVEEDGSLTNLEVLRDIGAGCGAEAARAVKAMPKWIPGKQQGKPVRVQFRLPVKFRLNR
ncbi:MAG: energy transducer TonB [Bacteroidetes bacterium]|nr:energy transducer TonB [Bacteroidota bacterium]